MNDYVRAMLEAAVAACEAENFAEADAALRFVMGAGAYGVVAWLIGHTALRRDGAAAALPWLTLAVAIDPRHPMAQRNLGDALRLLGRLDEAATAYRQAIAAEPDAIEPYIALVSMLHLLNRDAEALAWAEQGLRDVADAGTAHRMLAHALSWNNRHADALEHYQAAYALNPADGLARYHHGLDLLALGLFREGWQLHDVRRRLPHYEYQNLAGCPWQGEADITGQTILLHAEQGLGDALQFVRYVPLVAARGAEVWLQAHDALLLLFARIPGIAGVLPRHDPHPAPAWRASLLSLPLAFGTELTSIPTQVPYLHADRTRVAAWSARLGADRRRQIGLAWSGNPGHPHDRLRSIPLTSLAPLLARPDCVFHVVQTTMSDADRASLATFGVHDHSALLTDFNETAALMACLDLIVTIDSAPAHLAGALARPTWLLLSWNAEWRWMCDRPDSPWYPTMRLFRQPRPGDWDAVVAAVGSALDGAFRPDPGLPQ